MLANTITIHGYAFPLMHGGPNRVRDSLERIRLIEPPDYLRQRFSIQGNDDWLCFLLPYVAAYFRVEPEELLVAWERYYAPGRLQELREKAGIA